MAKAAQSASRAGRTAGKARAPSPAGKPKPKLKVDAPAKKRTSATRKPTASQQVVAKRVSTAAERDRRFNLLLQTACLKAGSAAAISTITARLPLLGKFAPALLGTVTETLALGRIQQQLVRDTLDLYDLELSELEERGVILLATAGSIGAQQLSKQMVEQIVTQLGGRYLRLFAMRALPIASLVTEIAAAIASTYAVGKRAQALCTLPGTGARNLGELLRSLTGIEQRKLFSWSGEALKLALSPLRGLLGRIPGAGKS
jgi:hypothetical protein